MARQQLGSKKLNKLIKSTGLDIAKAYIRGNTNHRVDLYLNDGRVFSLFKDGELVFKRDTWIIYK